MDNLLSLGDETWKLMNRVGVKEILIGAESGNQDVLDLINKKIDVEDKIRCFKKCAECNIGVFISLMVGLPGTDTKTEFEDTLKLIDRMLSMSHRGISNILIFNYTPYPGSPLYESAKKYGFNPPKDLEGWANMDLHQFRWPWAPQKYKNYVNNLSLYILPPLIRTTKKSGFAPALFYKIIIPIFWWRWKHKFFDFFLEKYVIDIARLVLKFKSKKFKVDAQE